MGRARTYNWYAVCVSEHGLEAIIHTDVIQDAENHNTVNLIG